LPAFLLRNGRTFCERFVLKSNFTEPPPFSPQLSVLLIDQLSTTWPEIVIRCVGFAADAAWGNPIARAIANATRNE
jgi:hypothetical protein